VTDISAPLIVEVLNSERAGLGLFRLHDAYTAITDAAGTVTVEAGYTTDFASIPFFARWILPQAGHSARAAVIHDWLLHKDASHSVCTKAFNEALKAGGTGPLRRWAMVAFVWLYTIKAPNL
jgi:hypothetical protein